MYFIGIDLGTSAVKLLLMDEKGHIENIVSKHFVGEERVGSNKTVFNISNLGIEFVYRQE